MDTLLFYVKNGEKLELSIIIRSRRHSSLTLCSVSRAMYCFVMLGGSTNDGVPGLFRIAAKFGGLLFQGKAIVVSDPAIKIGFHRVVPPYTATCSGA